MKILNPNDRPRSQNLDEIMESVTNLSDLEIYELLGYVAKRASYVSMDRVIVEVQTPGGLAIDKITYELGMSAK